MARVAVRVILSELRNLQVSIFQEPWWLSAVTAGRFEESVVKEGSDIVGRLPYVPSRKGPFLVLRMPTFTHILGPAIEAGEGKPHTRLMRRLSIARSLIDQLPRSSFFLIHLDPSLNDGLAQADGLAFQERGFAVSSQYTFEIDCHQGLDEMWAALYLKTRQHIRRAEKAYSVRTVDNPRQFVDFYLKNLKAWGRANRIDFTNFPTLFSECCGHKCGMILAAFQNDAPIAMTYLVWGHGKMFYLLSTRTFETSHQGAVSLLLWTAMKEAHQLGVILDLDGVYSSGTARFLSNFGGEIKTRLVIQRSSLPYAILQQIKRFHTEDETYNFT
jgi:hypothetical protein